MLLFFFLSPICVHLHLHKVDKVLPLTKQQKGKNLGYIGDKPKAKELLQSGMNKNKSTVSKSLYQIFCRKWFFSPFWSSLVQKKMKTIYLL